MCGMLTTFPPVVVEETAAHISPNGARIFKICRGKEALDRRLLEFQRCSSSDLPPWGFLCFCLCVRACVRACVCVCVRRHVPEEWIDVWSSGNRGIFSSSALSFPKPPLMLPETPSLDDNKDLSSCAKCPPRKLNLVPHAHLCTDRHVYTHNLRGQSVQTLIR